MTSSDVALRELEAWVQAEIAAKDRLRAFVEAQISAVHARSPRELEAATRAVSAELAAAVERDETRARLFRRIAHLQGAGASAWTLGDVVAHAGLDGAMLTALRAELRRATSDLLRAVRRMSALARLHRELVRDAIAAVAGSDALSRGGALVNTEA